MIQRLLRGWTLYLVLGGLIVLLYSLVFRRGMFVLHDMPATPTQSTMEWWPKEVNAAALQQFLSQQPLLAIAMSLLMAALVVMAFWGIGMTFWGLWSGRIRSVWAFPSQPLPRWSLGELGRILLLILMFASLLLLFHALSASSPWGRGLDLHRWITVSMFLLDLWIMLVIVLFATGKSPSRWKTFGFSRPAALPSITVGLRSYLAVFPWLFLVLFAVVEWARVLGIQPPTEPIQKLLFEEHRPEVLGLTFLLACVIGPIAEELLFRGVLYTAIRQRMSRGIAQWISAALFALVHMNLVGFLPIALLGYVLANLYERTGSLASSLVVHMLHNTLLMALAMAFRGLLSLGSS